MAEKPQEPQTQKFQTDLTEGGVARQLLRFSTPFMLSSLIQQSYVMADMLIVSRFAGKESVVGVSNGGQLTFFATAVAIGLSVGGTILVGQYYGAKRMEDVKKTIATMMTMLVLVSLAMTALFLSLGGVFLRLLQVPAKSVGEARIYMIICVCGLLFIFMYNAISGVLRGMGDSKRPLFIVGGACAVNVILDLILIAGLGMGAKGAAISTVVSQTASVIVASAYLARKGFLFDFRPKSFVIARDKLKLILKLGIPSSIQQAVIVFSFLLMTGLANSYGDDAISAATGLTGRYNGFAILPSLAVGNSVAMMSAQNLGAGRQDRALHTMRVGVGISMVIGVLVCAASQLFPRQIMSVLSNEQAVIEAGIIYMRSCSWDFLIVPFVFNFGGLVNGAGHSKTMLASTLLSSVGLRIPLAMLLSGPLGLRGLGLAIPLATMGTSVFLLLYLLSGRWKSAIIHKQEGAA